jgi:hypothetical protein
VGVLAADPVRDDAELMARRVLQLEALEELQALVEARIASLVDGAHPLP